ncbi:hypothetical protein DFJ74DRAFT_651088 [Hyaloraphidium curvatum]|nr:hypothetical protein DFJ74DRAFT_651088 [Hyaloraphidium curvatum]
MSGIVDGRERIGETQKAHDARVLGTLVSETSRRGTDAEEGNDEDGSEDEDEGVDDDGSEYEEDEDAANNGAAQELQAAMGGDNGGRPELMRTTDNGLLAHHGSEPINDIALRGEMYYLTFPRLFPFAHGGPKSRAEYPAWGQAMLLQGANDHATACDAGFLFHVFQTIRKDKSMLHSHLALKEDYFAESTANVINIPASVIHTYAAESAVGQEQRGNGQVPHSSVLDEQRRHLDRILELAKAVRAHVDGTSAERRSLRELLLAFCYHLQLPVFFITINPSEIYSPALELFAGNQDVRLEDPTTFLKPGDRAYLAARNPVATARWFKYTLNSLLATVIAPEDRAGAFGHSWLAAQIPAPGCRAGAAPNGRKPAANCGLHILCDQGRVALCGPQWEPCVFGSHRPRPRARSPACRGCVTF